MRICSIGMHLALIVFSVSTVLTSFGDTARGGGISVDAGLTPPERRYVLRAQTRYMEQSKEMSEMAMYKFPFVLAYGVRSDFTLMVKQIITRQTMRVGESTSAESGFDDFFILGKYKAYRRNTTHHILGIAPTLGMEMPTGGNEFSSETWDLTAGVYVSWRTGGWANDFNMAYTWNGITGRSKNGLVPGDKGMIDVAFAYQFSIGGSAYASLTPVLELNYDYTTAAQLEGDNVHDTGGSVFYVSPGLKYTIPSLVVEGLIRVPASWDQNGIQSDPALVLLAGIRLLF